MELLDHIVFSFAVFLLVIGLILEASGFGAFIAGHSGSLLLVIIGISLFWAGWTISGARSLSCALASALNMFDAASTLVFWNFEINPAVRYIGQPLFLAAKVFSSIAIVLYAKFHHAPKKGGVLLSLFFAVIVGWNLGQHTLAYLGLSDINLGLFFGTLLSLIAASIVVLMLSLGEKITLKPES